MSSQGRMSKTLKKWHMTFMQSKNIISFLIVIILSITGFTRPDREFIDIRVHVATPKMSIKNKMNSKSIKFLFILYTSICVEWSSTSWRDFRWFLLLWWSTFTWFRAEKFIAVQYIGLQYVVLKEKGPRRLSSFFRLDYIALGLKFHSPTNPITYIHMAFIQKCVLSESIECIKKDDFNWL